MTPNVAQIFRLGARHGLLVTYVRPESGAARGQLQAGGTPVTVAGETYYLGGDLIVAADGRALTTTDDLRDVISRKKPGDKLVLTLYRDTKELTMTVRLGRQPTSPQG